MTKTLVILTQMLFQLSFSSPISTIVASSLPLSSSSSKLKSFPLDEDEDVGNAQDHTMENLNQSGNNDRENDEDDEYGYQDYDNLTPWA